MKGNTNFVAKPEGTVKINQKHSKWKCYLFGLGEQFVLNPLKGKVPNFFWRWMQYICFGNKWFKEEE